jgi:hypothetical protein
LGGRREKGKCSRRRERTTQKARGATEEAQKKQKENDVKEDERNSNPSLLAWTSAVEGSILEERGNRGEEEEGSIFGDVSLAQTKNSKQVLLSRFDQLPR